MFCSTKQQHFELLKLISEVSFPLKVPVFGIMKQKMLSLLFFLSFVGLGKCQRNKQTTEMNVFPFQSSGKSLHPVIQHIS